MADQKSADSVNPEQAENPEQNYRLKNLYLKDLSFESPNAAKILVGDGPQDTVPVMRTNIKLTRHELENGEHEIAVRVTVLATSQNGETAYFLLEVEHAGVFVVNDMPEEDQKHLFTVRGPELIYPFSRQMIWSIVSAGGFPTLQLQDIDFNELARVE